MSIENSSILVGGTVSTTGGTSTALKSLGQSGNTHSAYLDGSGSELDRKSYDFTSKASKPKADAPNGYTQNRRNVVIKHPLALDNGKSTVNTLQITLSCDPETTDAERQVLIDDAMQIFSDPDFTDFFIGGSLG